MEGIVNVIDAKNGETLTLTKGQRAVSKRGSAPQLIANIPSVEYPGWLHGKLYFEKVTFAEACREIEMRFDVAVSIDDANASNEIVTGVLSARDAESGLAALSGLMGKKFQRSGTAYRIY